LSSTSSRANKDQSPQNPKKPQQNEIDQKRKQGVCHTVSDLAIYIKKYLKGKRRIMETQMLHWSPEKSNLNRKSSKRNQNPSIYY
jgi:hypothetical protein